MGSSAAPRLLAAAGFGAAVALTLGIYAEISAVAALVAAAER